MNLRNVDLNLLVVLDALLSERHVTRAGQRLGLTQPATSNALERLRDLFGDPLLERVPGGMRPTPRAEALVNPLRDALADLARLLRDARADLAALRQTVRLLIVDYGVELFIGPLHGALQATAPGIDLVVTPWIGADHALAALESGALDLAVSVVAPGAAGLRWHTLLHERYCVAMRRGHPAARGFDLDRWLAHPHVVVSGRGVATGALDAALAERGRTRRVGVVVPSFLAVPRLLAESDLVALLPERVVTLAGRDAGLIVRPPPIAVPGFEVGIAWHPRRDTDAATAHVREQLVRIAATRGTAPKPKKRSGAKRAG